MKFINLKNYHHKNKFKKLGYIHKIPTHMHSFFFNYLIDKSVAGIKHLPLHCSF